MKINYRFLNTAATAAMILMVSQLFPGAASAADKPCHSCHASKVTGAVPHPPVAEKDCKACHNSEGGNHQRQKGLFGVKKQGAALCYECHDNLAKEKSVHAPVKEGDCTGCHAPHHSPYKKLLKVALADLCFECHEKAKFSGKKFPHPPVVSGSCSDCHLPHQSPLAKLVKAGKVPLCYECHDAEMAKGKSVHAPVAENDCAGCHEPHGGVLAKFLKGNYPVVPETAFSEDAYSLCLSCHEKKAFTEDEINSATGFRDGKTNLHALHVKGASLSCRACHSVHAAPQEKLLNNATKAKNGSEILLNVTVTGAGGSCKMTCHSPSNYKR
ncbi:cytochrome C [Geobacter pelophilus]|uniref:Cytochrome C n=1 Tax=Geoanaerobacter pelophilus TaxID=60036 RepID=A0AAW4L1V5_9BACT|nr:cytochrome c3 family protein [Geoanaerobacter pelophilus]MBT0663485.1 cytochrome C [Geoanaerobacter pelophilus]